ncbi:acyl-CoA dehydrogenase family protein [Zhongshania marina]|uniref:Acyl-CoA dehydrogenase n=1 Tax=Zhongshania marina TaxID=2304603 RepID=A0ABX9W3M2_9GAMM|nr:acyl-CoA dehydrogenase [Zhongshania marina]
MSVYAAPIDEILFSMYDVNNFDAHYKSRDLDRDIVEAIIQEAAKLAEQDLFPLSAIGDREGARFIDGKVVPPSGFKGAYQKYVAGGWPSLAQPEQFGGQGLPHSLSTVILELWQSANQAWCMYSALGEGACETLLAYGSDAEKALYLPKLISGEWTGTMCLTESQAGSDLGLLRTKAEPTESGKYRITGSKIFISSGDHDLAENIVHLVLARLPDAPEGSRGISLFVVPKFKVGDDGSLGALNNVQCGSLEHKMGLKGSATCVMNFDGAEGFLLGPANKGLSCMFTFINKSRLGVAVQGQAQAEGAFQMSRAYAKDRLQGRSPCGEPSKDKIADPIAAQPDIQRMLLNQQVICEGGRVLAHFCAKLVDKCRSKDKQEAAEASELLSLLTPIAKGCLSEWGSEACDTGIQIFGGHGYVQEWGVEQRLRDVRITRIYEGTNGIQGLDLLGRKVLLDGGEVLQRYLDEIHAFTKSCMATDCLAPLATAMQGRLIEWRALNKDVFATFGGRPGHIEAIAFDYLMYSGYIVLAYQWLRIAEAASSKANVYSEPWLKNKFTATRFCFSHVLPRAAAHREAVLLGGEVILSALEGLE